MEHSSPVFEQIAASALELSPLEQVRLIETLMGALATVVKAAPAQKQPRETFYGSWKGESVSKEDIDEVRREMWTNAFREDDI